MEDLEIYFGGDFYYFLGIAKGADFITQMCCKGVEKMDDKENNITIKETKDNE